MMTPPHVQPDRLLLLTHRFPYPPNRGDRIRSYNLLRVLSEKYRVTLGCTTDETVSAESLEHVNKLCEHVIVAPLHHVPRMTRAIGGFLRGNSLTEGMFRSPMLHRKLQQIQKSDPFDLVVVFCSSMYSYVENAAFEASPIVVDLVDVDSKKWEQMSRESTFGKRWLYGSENSRVAALEQRIARRAGGVVLVSELEASVFRSIIDTDTPVHGISNGVDTDYFRPSDHEANPRL